MYTRLILFIFSSLILFPLLTGNTSSHPADEGTTIVEITFHPDHSWTADIFLDVETIILNVNPSDIGKTEQEALLEMYRNEQITTDTLRTHYQEFIMSHSLFLLDEQKAPYTIEYGKDPDFDYESALGESFWGRIQVKGPAIPPSTESFRFHYPKYFYPLIINITHPHLSAPLTDLFTKNTTRSTEPLFFSSLQNLEEARKKRLLRTQRKQNPLPSTISPSPANDQPTKSSPLGMIILICIILLAGGIAYLVWVQKKL